MIIIDGVIMSEKIEIRGVADIPFRIFNQIFIKKSVTKERLFKRYLISQEPH